MGNCIPNKHTTTNHVNKHVDRYTNAHTDDHTNGCTPVVSPTSVPISQSFHSNISGISTFLLTSQPPQPPQTPQTPHTPQTPPQLKHIAQPNIEHIDDQLRVLNLKKTYIIGQYDFYRGLLATTHYSDLSEDVRMAIDKIITNLQITVIDISGQIAGTNAVIASVKKIDGRYANVYNILFTKIL